VFELQINRKALVTPHITFLVLFSYCRVSRIERHDRLIGWTAFLGSSVAPTPRGTGGTCPSPTFTNGWARLAP